ncbi:hypothetical protein, partial [Staphylococcus aureus]
SRSNANGSSFSPLSRAARSPNLAERFCLRCMFQQRRNGSRQYLAGRCLSALQRLCSGRMNRYTCQILALAFIDARAVYSQVPL